MKHFGLLLVLLWDGSLMGMDIPDKLFHFDNLFQAAVDQCVPQKQASCEQKIKELVNWVQKEFDGENKEQLLKMIKVLTDNAAENKQ